MPFAVKFTVVLPCQQVASLGSPVHARGDAVGKGTCVMSFRMLGSRSTGGIALPGTGSTVSSSAQGEDSAIAGDFPSPPPRPTSNETRESEVKGRDGPTNGSAVRSAGEGIVEEGARRKADATGGSSAVAGRTDTSGLRVSTGAPGLNVSEWSLQSCDDADDEAVSDDYQPSLVHVFHTSKGKRRVPVREVPEVTFVNPDKHIRPPFPLLILL